MTYTVEQLAPGSYDVLIGGNLVAVPVCRINGIPEESIADAQVG